MKKFEFFGHSDDLFCVTGNCLEEQSGFGKLAYELRDAESSESLLIIYGEYAVNSDCWAITIEPTCEAVLPLSNWTFEYNPKDYGCQLIVTTPDNVECHTYEK